MQKNEAKEYFIRNWRKYMTPEQYAKCCLLEIAIARDFDGVDQSQFIVCHDTRLWIDADHGEGDAKRFESVQDALDATLNPQQFGCGWRKEW
jgi:hypothetical protein